MRISDGSSDVCSSDLPARNRLGRINADSLLRQETAIGEDQPIVAGRSAQSFGHRRDRVHRIIIPRTAEEGQRSEEHTSELQSLMRISYAVFCLKKKKITRNTNTYITNQK